MAVPSTKSPEMTTSARIPSTGKLLRLSRQDQAGAHAYHPVNHGKMVRPTPDVEQAEGVSVTFSMPNSVLGVLVVADNKAAYEMVEVSKGARRSSMKSS